MNTDETKSWLWGRHSALACAIASATTAIDQAHKWWMILVFHIEEKGRVAVLPFLDVVYVLNKGISYSLLNMSSQGGQMALAAFALLASVWLWVWSARADSRLLVASLALIIGGAVGNGIDRLTLGGVADFFLAHAYGYSWYVFNIADVAIVAGVAGLLYESLVASRKDATKHL
jgi:signal peptidase II